MEKKRKCAFFGSFCLMAVVALLAPLTKDAHSGQAPASTLLRKIVIATPSEPDTLDLNSSKMDGVSAPIAENLTERLIGITPEGQLIPLLATSWKVSSDGREIEFVLRKGVKFHSGDPFTAKDLQFSHERGLKSSTTYQRTMRMLESFTVIDDYRVRFRFKTPDAQVLPGRGTPVESKAYYDRVGEEKFLREPIGTGPYRFVKWEPSSYIEVRANEEYWGTKPAVKEARFAFVKEDTTRVSMLKAGEADMILECPFPLIKEVESAGFRTARLPSHPSTSVQFHTYNPKVPWHDKRVREAVAHAIDRNAIVNRLFQGIPGLYARLCPWELGYDPDLKPYPYDPDKAKKLLAEAGYTKGFEMPLYFFAGRASGQAETAEAVAGYLSAVGIRCKIQGIEAIKMIEMTREWHKSTEAVAAGVTTVPTNNYAEPTQALEIGFYSQSPISLFRNAEFDAALEKARVTLNDEKRAELIRQAVRILHDDVASVLLWSNVTVYAMNKNITFTPTFKATHALIMLKDIRPAN
jgi:peptide/nickel transport system substrate-binding protein